MSGRVSRHPPVLGRGGAKMIMPFRPSLAGDKVMHVGDPVAMVVAETSVGRAGRGRSGAGRLRGIAGGRSTCDDADERTAPSFTPKRPAISASTGLARCLTNRTSVMLPRAIAKAPHVAKVRVANQRMVVASMETRGATGVYDKANDSYTLYVCSQSADSSAQRWLPPSWACRTRSCASSPRMSAAPSA